MMKLRRRLRPVEDEDYDDYAMLRYDETPKEIETFLLKYNIFENRALRYDETPKELKLIS